MARKKSTTRGGLILGLMIFTLACQKSPTPVSLNLGENSLVIACQPVSGGAETLVHVAVVISQNSEEVRVFGLEMSFDSKVFQFQKVTAGNLTGGWAAVDGNEVSSGLLRIGGFAGGGTAIARNNQGALALVQLKVTGTSFSHDQPSQICANHYTDDLAKFLPAPACTTFTLKK